MDPSATASTSTVSPARTGPATVLADVQSIIAYEFNNPALLLEALRGAGCGLSLFHGPHSWDGHKRLAMLGDGVLRTVILTEWYMSNSDRCKMIPSMKMRDTDLQ